MLDLKINITAVNRLADEINNKYFSAINEPIFEYKAEVSGKKGRDILKNSLIREVLYLKKGMQLLFIKNNLIHGYYNGSLGEIVRFNNDARKSISVKMEDGRIINVKVEEWREGRTIIQGSGKQRRIEKITDGSVVQYPFIPGWAFSVHKSQGLTFDRMVFDNRCRVFENGQLYVALSRCRSLEGITIIKALVPQDVKVDKRITCYWEECGDDTRYLEVWKQIHDMPNESEYDDEESFKEFTDVVNEYAASLW